MCIEQVNNIVSSKLFFHSDQIIFTRYKYSWIILKMKTKINIRCCGIPKLLDLYHNIKLYNLYKNV